MGISSLPLIDVILLVFVLGFVSIGFWFGFVHMVGSVVGLFGGALVAGFYYEPVAGFLIDVLHMEPNNAKLLAFFVLLTLVTRAIGFLMNVVNGIFKITSIIPFVKTFDRLLGSLLGLIEGVIVVGLLVFFSSRFPLGDAFVTALEGSRLAHPLNFFGKILTPLLPEAIRLMQSTIF